MRDINKDRFIEVQKELTICFNEVEQLKDFYEAERNKCMRKYYKKVKENHRLKETIKFCIENMRNEFTCTDKRTKQELKSMVEMLEDLL